MNFKHSLLAAACCTLFSAQAAEFDNGFEFSGYSRGGPTFTYNKDQNVKGGLTLGGDLQKYRLGNEGDSGYEIFLGKTFDAGEGIKYKFGYMPNKWNNSNVGTAQAYAELWGLDFAPDMKFWVGQRRLRIRDVHIVDHFLVNSGEYQGGGFSNLNLGPVNVAATLSSGDTFDTKLAAGTSANKLNIDIGGLQTNPGGSVRMLLTTVTSSGFASSGGNGLSILHNQSDFLTPGLTNSLYLQTSSGLAKITGEFVDLTTNGAATVGVKSSRIADSITWQSGKFGGQALVGYQTSKADNSNVTTSDTSLGGRISYGVTKNFKMLVEASTTQRTFDNGADGQTLNKITIAPTLSTGPDFWKRPELRFYVTYANWNDAAALANLSTFGSTANSASTKLQSQTLVGMQYEIWW